MVELLLYNIANIFKFLCQVQTLIFCIILGYIWIDTKLFLQATYILLTSLFFNYALKITFQIPLNPMIGPGFAFPSGHMQASFVFYGWIIAHTPITWQRKMMLSFILFSGISYSLIYFGYHNLIDILGAWFSGSMLLLFYYYLTQVRRSPFSSILFLFNSLLLAYISLHQFPSNGHLFLYTLLLELLFFQPYIEQKSITTTHQKICITLFCLLLFIGRKIFI